MSTGIYFHIPFCEAKCSYCHFVTRPFNEDLAERYCEAIVREMKLFFATYPCPERVDTIYFCGGTPSLVGAEGIGIILEACRSTLRIDPDSEITLEANPESISAAKVDAYRRMGVNRISIGAQSFNERQLDVIGRHHSGDQIIDCVALLQARGFDNLNLDLMLGLPGQNED